MIKNYFQQLADYNRWANKKLYDGVANLSKDEFEQDLGVFFNSIKGTLNHLLVGDILWFERLQKQTPPGYKLDDSLYEDFDSLWSARQKKDEEIIAFVNTLNEDHIGEMLHYKTAAGKEMATETHMALGTVFNHHTHHRGQVTACLSRLGKETPALDIIYYIAERQAQ